MFFLSKGWKQISRLFTEFPRDRIALLILRDRGDMTDPDRLTDGEREWRGGRGAVARERVGGRVP